MKSGDTVESGKFKDIAKGLKKAQAYSNSWATTAESDYFGSDSDYIGENRFHYLQSNQALSDVSFSFHEDDTISSHEKELKERTISFIEKRDAELQTGLEPVNLITAIVSLAERRLSFLVQACNHGTYNNDTFLNELKKFIEERDGSARFLIHEKIFHDDLSPKNQYHKNFADLIFDDRFGRNVQVRYVDQQANEIPACNVIVADDLYARFEPNPNQETASAIGFKTELVSEPFDNSNIFIDYFDKCWEQANHLFPKSPSELPIDRKEVMTEGDTKSGGMFCTKFAGQRVDIFFSNEEDVQDTLPTLAAEFIQEITKEKNIHYTLSQDFSKLIKSSRNVQSLTTQLDK